MCFHRRQLVDVALAIVLSLVAMHSWADLYIANFDGPSITVYPPSAVGNAAPTRVIAGNSTGIAGPEGATVDTVNNELYVADFVSSSIRVFTLAANGNVSPVRTIAGPTSGIAQPRQVAVDTVNNEIYVLSGNDSIRVFPRLASGDPAPTRVIAGVNTTFSNPLSLALDAVNNELIVTTFDSQSLNGRILAFARTANGDVPPLRSIFGSNTQIGRQSPIATVDPVNNEIIARVNPDSPTIASALLVFSRTANGNVAPLRTLSGSATGLYRLGGVKVDLANNRIITTNEISNQFDVPKVLVFSRVASGNVKPLMTIAGPATGLHAPNGIDVDVGGGPVSTVTDSTLPTANPQAVSTALNTPITLTLTASDPDNASFTFDLVSEPVHGQITSFNSLTGTLTYVPNNGFSGLDTFAFVASDVVNTSLPATITIGVAPIATNVPTLDIRALIALGAILIGAGIFALRARAQSKFLR